MVGERSGLSPNWRGCLRRPVNDNGDDYGKAHGPATLCCCLPCYIVGHHRSDPAACQSASTASTACTIRRHQAIEMCKAADRRLNTTQSSRMKLDHAAARLRYHAQRAPFSMPRSVRGLVDTALVNTIVFAMATYTFNIAAQHTYAVDEVENTFGDFGGIPTFGDARPNTTSQFALFHLFSRSWVLPDQSDTSDTMHTSFGMCLSIS